MTKDEWASLKVGDILVDHRHGDVEREVLTVRHYTVRRTTRRSAWITLASVRPPHRSINVHQNDDWAPGLGVGHRFSLKPRSP